ncbi:MAG: hypothetical protein GYA15_10390 [Leptolinea sp.]|jgi:hypothetical protein|nr:hypothetical protein [Leptolinea sp.]
MTERKNPFTVFPLESSPMTAHPVRHNQIIMNQIFASTLKQSQSQQDYSLPFPVEKIKHPPLPDGTGQIINIGK